MARLPRCRARWGDGHQRPSGRRPRLQPHPRRGPARALRRSGRRAEAPAASGEPIFVDGPLLRETANHRLITSGLAYPTFYTKLYLDQRKELTEQAQAACAGVFADDRTQSGVTFESLATLTDSAVILPKLFRRLVEYLQLNDGDSSLAGFGEFLSQRDNRLWIVPTGQKTGFDTAVAVDGETVKLTRLPEDLVFEK